MIVKRTTFIFLVLVASFQFLGAQPPVLPLQEQSWQNETFRKRFLGTYGVKSEIEPSITQAEKELFEVLIPLVQQDQIPQAVTALRDYMNKNAEYSAALDFTLGNLYFQENQLKEGAAAYQAAVKKFPTFSRAYENLGRIAVMSGDYETARQYLVQALELGGPKSDLYGLLGYSYLNLEKPSSALVAYDSASLLDPASKDWQLGRAQALVQSQRYDEAIPLLKELVNEDVTARNLVLSISNAYLDKGEYLMSALYLELLNRSGNANNSSLLLLGDIYMNENLPALALPVYKQAMASASDRLPLTSAMRVARIYVERGLNDSAQSVVADVERIYAGDLSESNRIELLNLKSRMSLAQGKTDEAREYLQEIIDVEPMNGDALVTLANLYWQLNDYASAQHYFTRARDVASVKFKALLDNGRMLVEQSEYREAAKLLASAYDLNPSDNLREYLDAVQQIASR